MGIRSGVIRSRGRLLLAAIVLFVVMFLCASGPPLSLDEGIWTCIARLWIDHDIPPYTGALDNKPAGLIDLYALSYLLAGVNPLMPRLLGALALTVSAVMLYSLGRRMLDPRAGQLAMLTFGLAMPWGAMGGGHLGHSESFMILGELGAVWALWSACHERSRPGRIRGFLLTGALAAWAVNCKQTAVLDWPGLVALYLFWSQRAPAGKRSPFEEVGLALLGGAAVSVLLALPVLLAGAAATDYIRAITVEVGASRSVDSWRLVRVWRFLSTFRNTDLLLFYPLLAAFLLQRNALRSAGVPWTALLIWLAGSFLAVNAAGTYYPHQVRQWIAPLALMGGLGIGNLLQRNSILRSDSKAWWWVLLVTALLWMPWTSLFRSLVLSEQDRNRSVARHLKEWSDPEDRVFAIGGRGPQILAWAGRRTPSRHVTLIHARIGRGRAEIRKDFDRHPPLLLVIPQESADGEPDWMTPLRLEHYRLRDTIEGCRVYIRNNAQRADTP